MLYLAFRMGRRRLVALLAVASAVLGGAALVTAIGVLAESGLRSHAPVGRLHAADVVVSAGQSYRGGDVPIALPERARVPAGVADRLAALPGVAGVVGDVSFPAAVVAAGGRVVPSPDPAGAGHGWSSTALLGAARVEGTAPAGPGDVALDRDIAAAAGVRPGDRVTVVAAGRSGTYRVRAVLGAAGGVFFHDDTARRLAGRDDGGSDLIGVLAVTGEAGTVADAVRTELRGTGLVVSTGAARGDAGSPGAIAARNLLPALAASLAGVTLLMVGFIVGGALAVSIGAQRRDLALLRAVGSTPRQIRRLAAGQATIVAAVALVPGVAAGYLVAERFRLVLVSSGMLPDGLPLTMSPLPGLAAGLLLIAAVQVSARAASWRTSRRPATEAVAESLSEPRTPARSRGLVGMLILAAAGTLAVTPLLVRSQVGAAGTVTAGLLAAIGLAVAGPALVVRLGDVLVRRLPAGAPAPAWLAVANIRGYALRVAGAVATLAMVVVFTLTYALTQTTMLRATADEVRAGTVADLSVAAPALGGVPGDVLAGIRATPGVLGAAGVSTTTVVWPYRFAGGTEADSAAALVLTPAAAGVLDLDVRAGDLAGLTGATVAVDERIAKARDATVGSTVSLVLGDGHPVEARVVALYGRGLGFGPVALSRDLAAGHTTTGLDQQVLVRTDGTAAAADGLAALVASRPGLVPAGTSAVAGGGLAPELWINVVVLGVLLGYLLLSIANKLVAATVQRRGELALLQLVGTTPGQVRAMMRREASLIGAAAVGAGVLLSALPLALLAIGFLGRPWPAGPVWLLPALAAMVAGLVWLSVELPTRRALRTSPLHRWRTGA